jgi:hypothetical protein
MPRRKSLNWNRIPNDHLLRARERYDDSGNECEKALIGAGDLAKVADLERYLMVLAASATPQHGLPLHVALHVIDIIGIGFVQERRIERCNIVLQLLEWPPFLLPGLQIQTANLHRQRTVSSHRGPIGGSHMTPCMFPW